VTDANLVLGRLDPEGFLGGRMGLDTEAARAAVARLAGPLGLPIEEAALGIVRIADEHMAQALRAISVERGLDPRDFVLTSFGGAGGLSVCALAEALGMDRALVPVHAGVLSALGMLAAPPGRTLTRARLGLLEALGDREIDQALGELTEQAIAALAREGLERESLQVHPALDLRYRGQSYTLELCWAGVPATLAAFHEQHAWRYGHRLEMPVELVNLRVRVRGPAPLLTVPVQEVPLRRTARPVRRLAAWGSKERIPVYPRDTVLGAEVVSGPALIADPVATTWLAPGWEARTDAVGNLILVRPGRR
jgi:N-methylhydantoinase A